MNLKKITAELNFFNKCQEYNLPLWQCPTFLFVLTGLITVVAMLGTYFIGIRYANPEIVALIVTIVTAVFIIVGYLVIQGVDRLARSNQMKSDFLSIVSHQLRTPLTGIKWALNIADLQENTDFNDKPKKEAFFENLKQIEQSNERMIDLVNDLLNVSRIEQDRIGFKPEKIDLKKTIEGFIKEYAPFAKASNVELRLVTGPHDYLIKADARGIELALKNLIENAIKYIKGEGRVVIRLKEKRRRVIVGIEDNGVGIPKGDRRNIFKKFFRSQNVLKYQTVGTGLGLFIAKAFIQKSKGKISFKSKEGQGTIFWVDFPKASKD